MKGTPKSFLLLAVSLFALPMSAQVPPEFEPSAYEIRQRRERLEDLLTPTKEELDVDAELLRLWKLSGPPTIPDDLIRVVHAMGSSEPKVGYLKRRFSTKILFRWLLVGDRATIVKFLAEKRENDPHFFDDPETRRLDREVLTRLTQVTGDPEFAELGNPLVAKHRRLSVALARELAKRPAFSPIKESAVRLRTELERSFPNFLGLRGETLRLFRKDALERAAFAVLSNLGFDDGNRFAVSNELGRFEVFFGFDGSTIFWPLRDGRDRSLTDLAMARFVSAHDLTPVTREAVFQWSIGVKTAPKEKGFRLIFQSHSVAGLSTENDDLNHALRVSLALFTGRGFIDQPFPGLNSRQSVEIPEE